MDTYGSYDNKVFTMGEWMAHKDCVWQLVYHPYEPYLLSSSADTTVKMWLVKESTKDRDRLTFNCVQTFQWKPKKTEADIPTSVAFVQTDLGCIVSGFAFSKSLEIFDRETGRVLSHLPFKVEDAGAISAQVNRVACHTSLPMVVSGHEDHRIRVFDLNSAKMVTSKPGHDDAVTGLSFHPSKLEFTSVGHDGRVKVWDLRNYSLIAEVKNVRLILVSSCMLISLCRHITSSLMNQFIVCSIIHSSHLSPHAVQMLL
jgi:striatin 1/3/4